MLFNDSVLILVAVYIAIVVIAFAISAIRERIRDGDWQGLWR